MELILNADDFGRSHEINRAIIRAHQEGVLNSASLMVAGRAASEAVELARQHPSLAVGLHLVVVDGPAAAPAHEVPRLVNPSGQFPDAPVRAGLLYAFSRSARRELRLEIKTQFERFAATGLRLDHVDGHQHLHMHPVVFDMLVPLARQYGAGRIRIVRDDLRLALGYDRRGALGKAMATFIFALLARRCRRIGQLAGVSRTYGFLQSGRMTEAYVLSILQQLETSAEIYFHPTEGERLNPLGPNPQELAVLLSEKVRKAVEVKRQQCDVESAPDHAGDPVAPQRSIRAVPAK